MTSVPDWLQRRAESHGAHPALLCDGRVHTFADLARSARGFERLLRTHDVGAGHVVATLLHGGPDLVALAHAVPRDGRVFAPLGIRLTATELGEMLDRCKATALLYEGSTADVAAGVHTRAPLIKLRVDGTPAADGAATHAPRADLDAIHTILFTSGTSGSPKAVRLTWGNHLWSAMGAALNLGLRPEDRWLCCLPLNHVGGLSILVRGALYGNTVELHRRFDPAAVNAAIDGGATIVSVVANMMQRMLDERRDRPYPPTLRAILAGGGPIPRALIERCRDARVPITPTYGLTETASQVATASPDGCSAGVGHPLPFTEIRIVDGDGHARPAGSPGEILVRGPMVSPGELGETRAADAWLHTRDRGWIDERGHLHVLGRGDDTVICGGENIHPGEVERALESHPAVAEAFACGFDDPEWGQVLHAAVRASEAVDEMTLIAHCRGILAGYKIPRRVRIISEFPRTPSGKIARGAAAATVRRFVESRIPGESNQDATMT